VLSANEHAEIFVCILLLNEFDGYFPCLSLAKIRDTVPLNSYKNVQMLLLKHSNEYDSI